MDNFIEDFKVSTVSAREQNLMAGKTMIYFDAFTLKTEAMQRLSLIQQTSYNLENEINRIGTQGMTLSLVEKYETLKNVLREIEVEEGANAIK